MSKLAKVQDLQEGLEIHGMSRPRILLLHVLIALLIGGSLYDTVTFGEHWPFSSFKMYSRPQRERSLSALRLFGVTREEPHREIPLLDFQHIQPFNQSRLRMALERLNNGPQRQQLLDEAVRDCLTRYETLRRAGRHDGPLLQGIRLYWLWWRLDPQAKNVDRPDRRTLLAEVQQPVGG